MANAKLLVPIIKKWEGGYSNHPADSGGETNMGITHITYDNYRRKKGLSVRSVKFITDEEWFEIFKTYYWDTMKADQIHNQSIANLCVNMIWGSGSGYIKIIQRSLKVKDDGIVGAITINAINSSNQRELHAELWTRRKAYFEAIVAKNPSQRVFLRGWINRLNDFKFSI